MPILRNCLTCNKEFYVKPYRIKEGFGKYCGRKCQPSPTKGNYYKGGITIHEGYCLINTPNHPNAMTNNYIKRCRVIIEKELKRFLKKTEIVHHVNKIKNDDRIENLIVFSSQSAHIRFHKSPDNIETSEIIFDGRLLQKHETAVFK